MKTFSKLAEYDPFIGYTFLKRVVWCPSALIRITNLPFGLDIINFYFIFHILLLLECNFQKLLQFSTFTRYNCWVLTLLEYFRCLILSVDKISVRCNFYILEATKILSRFPWFWLLQLFSELQQSESWKQRLMKTTTTNKSRLNK